MQEKLFHDQGYIYFSPLEPTSKDEVTVRLQSADDLNSAFVSVREKDSEVDTEYPLSYDGRDKTGKFYLWKGVIPAREKPYRYCFKAKFIDKSIKYFDVYGESDEFKPDCGFYVIPNFSTPDWSKGIFWYSILPDAFYNGNVLNDKAGEFRDAAKGAGDVHPYCSRYGGDLRGIIKKLDYVKDLNADAIFINPIWTCKDAGGYGPDNFDMLDTAYGTDAELCELIDEVHKRNLKIMLDAVVVFSTQHSNLYNINDEWPNIGASKDENSKYCNYFYFKHWPDSYQNYFSSLDFDYSRDEAKDYIYRNPDSHLQRYLKEPYNIDAWRFDSASLLWGQNMTPVDVAADIKKYLKPINPDMLFLSECYANMDEGVWETCWNMHQLFNLREWMMQKYDINFFLKKTRMYSNARCRPLALSLYTHFDNHDVPRLYPIISEKARLFSGIIWHMTYIGSPTLFYGDETGKEYITSGYYHSFNWNTEKWDTDFYHLYKTLSDLRHKYPLFKLGIVRVGFIDNDAELITYGRFDENGSAVIVLNPHSEQKHLEIEVDCYEISDGDVLTDVISGREYTVLNGKIIATVNAGGAVFIKNCAEGTLYFESLKKENILPQSINSDPFVPDCDWSYSFKIDCEKFTTSHCIYVGESKKDAVYLSARSVDDKIQLQLGRMVSNIKVPLFEKNIYKADITVQLQRIGTRYSAAYMDNMVWNEIGSNLPAAFGETHIGVIENADGITSLGIGNTEVGGKAVCTPFAIKGFEGNWSSLSKTTKIARQCVKSGEFDYINGGLIQKSYGDSLLLYDRAFNSFRITAVIQAETDKGECGILFGAESDGGNGYRYSTDGKRWNLQRNGKVIANGESFGLEIIVEQIGGKTVIYSGKNTIPVFCESLEQNDGYVGFFSAGTAYKLLNYYVTDLAPTVSQQNIFWGINGNSVNYRGTGTLGVKGNSYAKFKASVQVSIKEPVGEGDAFAGILVSSEGYMPKKDGLFLSISSNGKAYLKQLDTVIAETAIEGTEHKLEISCENGDYELFVDGNKLTSYKDERIFGGSVSITCINADVTFDNFKIII